VRRIIRKAVPGAEGPPARREEGAYLKRYVTDEQRGRRPIFNATKLKGFRRRYTSSLRTARNEWLKFKESNQPIAQLPAIRDLLGNLT
jgi:hypothetical protein